MGYNSTIVICNDGLDQIAKDAEVGKHISEAISSLVGKKEGISVGLGNHCNPIYVVETHHADSVVLLAVGANYGRNLGHVCSWREMDNDVAILRGLAERLGYRISKKPTR